MYQSGRGGGIGADSVLECVGTQESLMQAIRSADNMQLNDNHADLNANETDQT
jgi:hypothetical protein